MNRQQGSSARAVGWRPRRLKLLLLLLAIVLTTTWGYIQFFLSRPVGSGPAGPPVALAPFQKPWTTRAVHLLGVGDSVTRGLGADAPNHSYFSRLIKNPHDEFADMQGRCLARVLPSLTSSNIAVSGSTSLQHEQYIQERLAPFPAEVFGLVVMTTGGNDLIHNYGRSPPREGAMYGADLEQAQPWIEAFRDRLHRMFDAIDTVFPGGCEIFLADIYDPTDGIGDAPSVFLPDWPDGLAIHAAYNQVIYDVAAARDNLTVVPLYEHFLGHGAHCQQFWRANYDPQDPHYWFYQNVEDPNDRGYDAIRRVFLNSIVQASSLRQQTVRPGTE